VTNERIEELVEKVQSLPDAHARETALELVQAILDLHADALDRMMEIIAAGEEGPATIDALATDPRTSSILLLHDLHPLDLETRVARALANPAFRSRGASVELVAVQDGIVRVRMEGGHALKQAVEKALWEAAPEAVEILVEGATDQVANNFVSLEALLTG
jgi:Fe-S cluster biogenesis protein NfuA